ncbi:tail completion protein gp17 [Comamonas odontotermitis]|uniref:tail completion protein gp17 n=1 Tax=Comamonas odontotermitis TaxID=379895 RepID=UPI001CC8279A|nr:DUF3168 domain-containing protein [Comamonas odontotermitis]UBB16135.1 DUF3168 domain-containing protein [Comamonas odontotermitis]
MSLESDLLAVIGAHCPRVFVGTAPYNTKTPYVTWQHIGGDPLRYLDSEAADKRNAQIQINTWDATALDALALILRLEEAICKAPQFQAEAYGQPVLSYDDADIAKGYLMTFSITGAR